MSSYQSFVLLNYRVACAEQRKKENEIEVFQRILNAGTLRDEIDSSIIEDLLYGYQLGIKVLGVFQSLIATEINSPKQIFHFEEFRYPLIKVYGAALFGATDENTEHELDRTEFDDVFIHVIPLKTSLSIMCGYLKTYKTDWTAAYVNSWKNLTEADLKANPTNLFAARIENWGIAPSLFESIPQRTVDKMVVHSGIGMQ